MSGNDLRTLDERFARDLQVRNRSKQTISGLRWKLGKFFDYLAQFGITEADGITKDIVKAYQAEICHTINN